MQVHVLIVVSLLFFFFDGAVVVALQESQRRRPNFIVLQPDDFMFLEAWKPPAHFPNPNNRQQLPENIPFLPNMERLLKSDGSLQMMQAYTSSPMCGTSRYSTVTGRYPSRSSLGRLRHQTESVSNVRIPTTKLHDEAAIVDGNDCSEHNLAAVLSKNGYRTGVVGKWHLSSLPSDYTYETYTAAIQECGWQFVQGIYAENLGGFWNDGSFSHNMEYITDKAVQFLREEDDRPFFLYFNPTAPHGSGDVYDALTLFPCTATPEGRLEADPSIPGMTELYDNNCIRYRQSVINRAGNSTNAQVLAAIWMDDAVGSLFTVLEELNQLENTFFLFQLDHGREGKGTLLEPGIRIPQLVHFPAAFGSSNSDNNVSGSHSHKQWHGLVSTVDIGPTILDFAGVTDSYPMDGLSWKNAVLEHLKNDNNSDATTFWMEERCLIFELGYDRAVRCGCDKYMRLDVGSQTLSRGTFSRGQRFGVAVDEEVLLNLCNDAGTAVTSPNDSPEVTDLKTRDPDKLAELRSIILDHLEKTRPSNDPVIYTPLQIAPTPWPTTVPTPTSPSPVAKAMSPTTLTPEPPTQPPDVPGNSPSPPTTTKATASPTTGLTPTVLPPTSSPVSPPNDASAPSVTPMTPTLVSANSWGERVVVVGASSRLLLVCLATSAIFSWLL